METKVKATARWVLLELCKLKIRCFCICIYLLILDQLWWRRRHDIANHALSWMRTSSMWHVRCRTHPDIFRSLILKIDGVYLGLIRVYEIDRGLGTRMTASWEITFTIRSWGLKTLFLFLNSKKIWPLLAVWFFTPPIVRLSALLTLSLSTFDPSLNPRLQPNNLTLSNIKKKSKICRIQQPSITSRVTYIPPGIFWSCL